MNVFTLVLYTLSITTIVIGLVNYFRSSDVIGVKISGLISVLIGLSFSLFLFFNIPISAREASTQLHVLSTLSISIFFSWSLFTAMLPVISMRPAWFNLKNVITAMHPIFIVLFVVIINRYFVNNPADSIQSNEAPRVHQPDMILRYIWFLCTLVYCIWHIYWPFFMLPKAKARRPTHWLYINQFLLLIALIFFVLTLNGGVWIYLYQTLLMLITLISSLSFFWKDAYSVVKKKQLSLSTADEAEEVESLNIDIAEKQLRLERAAKMLELFKTNELLQDPDFTLQQLSDLLKLDKGTTQDVILLLGYAGFNEMIGNIRCDKFKQIAHAQIQNNQTPRIRPIMEEIGLSSYERFAKLFKSLNDSSPEQYIEWLQTHKK